MKSFLRASAMVPAITILLFYAYAAGWRIYLGEWPRYGRPSVESGFPIILEIALFILLAASAVSIVPTVLVAAACLMRRRLDALWPGGVLAIASWALFITVFRFDPGGLLDWFLD